jgi:hypothetical protein
MILAAEYIPSPLRLMLVTQGGGIGAPGPPGGGTPVGFLKLSESWSAPSRQRTASGVTVGSTGPGPSIPKSESGPSKSRKDPEYTE